MTLTFVCSGHKWSLKTLWQYLDEKGVDTQVRFPKNGDNKNSSKIVLKNKNIKQLSFIQSQVLFLRYFILHAYIPENTEPDRDPHSQDDALWALWHGHLSPG